MTYESRLQLANADLEAWINEHYGVEVTVGDVRAGYMSTVVWLEGEGQRYILKVYGEENIEQISYGMRVAETLLRYGLPAAECLLSRQGDDLISLNGQHIAVWSFLAGEGFCPGNQRQLEAAGRLLGQFHKATHSLVDDAPVSFRLEAVFFELKEIWDLVPDGDVLALIPKFKACLRELEEAIHLNLPHTVIHTDYRAQNLLFHQDRVSGLLDLDGCCRGPRIFDLVYALAFFQAVIAQEPLSESEMLAFLFFYSEQVELTDTELDRLGLWLSLALLQGLSLWLRIGYIENVHRQARLWIVAYSDFFQQNKAVANRLATAIRNKG